MQIWTLLGCGAKQVVQPPSGCNYSIPQQLMTKKKHHFRGAITCHRIALTCSWLLVYYTLSRNIFRLEELTALSDYVRSHLDTVAQNMFCNLPQVAIIVYPNN